VVNTGASVSDETVLLFTSFRGGRADAGDAGDAEEAGDDAPEWPLRELLGFRRLCSVQPGQSVHLSWQVSADDLRLASTPAAGDAGGQLKWRVPAGKWLLTSSACRSSAHGREPAARGGAHPCALEFEVEDEDGVVG
jgi:hypothetical protein